MGLSSIFTTLLLSAATPNILQCPEIPGWNQVLDNQKLRYIVLGEFHGTNEMPQIFGDAVCLTSQARPVVVALEMPQSDQALIDAYLASDGGSDAQRAFLHAQIWKNEFKDGRSSEAMFALFDRLRNLKGSGKIKSVIAFQPMQFLSNAKYEKAMAGLIEKNTPKGFTALVLVGNVHAMQTEVTFGPTPYLAMAAHLPEKTTLTLDIVNNGGTTWACSGPNQCGVMTSGKSGESKQSGVILNAKGDSPYGGQLFLGSSTTASMPQQPSAE